MLLMLSIRFHIKTLNCNLGVLVQYSVKLGEFNAKLSLDRSRSAKGYSYRIFCVFVYLINILGLYICLAPI